MTGHELESSFGTIGISSFVIELETTGHFYKGLQLQITTLELYMYQIIAYLTTQES